VPLYELALALLVLTGRRTTEVLNGRSAFDAAPDPREHACLFVGQLKARSARAPYRIPLLAPFADVAAALACLRRRQAGGGGGGGGGDRDGGGGGLSNVDVSRRYQSGLGQHLKAHPVYASLGKVHALRAVYANACLHLFDWSDRPWSDNAVVMHVLGHASPDESLAYTAMRVEFSEASARGSLGRF
jgi:hypothetical protein